jgi:hypothetical protein
MSVPHTLILCSDGHRNKFPHGYTGMGVTGTGTGAKFLPSDVPVPVWVGDRSVMGPVQSDVLTVSAFSTLSKLTPPPPHRLDGELKTTRVGDGLLCPPP